MTRRLGGGVMFLRVAPDSLIIEVTKMRFKRRDNGCSEMDIPGLALFEAMGDNASSRDHPEPTEEASGHAKAELSSTSVEGESDREYREGRLAFGFAVPSWLLGH